MNINLFVNSLTLDEKKELFNELKTDFQKGETLFEFYKRLEKEMSNRMRNILGKSMREYPDWTKLRVFGETDQLWKIRGFGNSLMEELEKLKKL